MKERPILFSGPMVRAILDGKKTQTRRVVKPQPAFPHLVNDSACTIADTCPYGQPGDRLWVRETWRMDIADSPGCGREVGIEYRADDEVASVFGGSRRRLHHCGESQESLWIRWDLCSTGHYLKWKPSIFMPRWASRLTLEIVSVRVERLQDISPEDAIAEGVCRHGVSTWECATSDMTRITWCHPFVQIWDSLNAKKHPWQSNPWVWVVEFKVVSL